MRRAAVLTTSAALFGSLAIRCASFSEAEPAPQNDGGAGADGQIQADGQVAFSPDTQLVLVKAERSPTAIATNATGIYWVTPTEIRSTEKRAGAAVTTIASGQLKAFDIAVDATFAYWSVQGINSADAGDNCGLMRAPLAGGAAECFAKTGQAYVIAESRMAAVPKGFSLLLHPLSSFDQLRFVPRSGGQLDLNFTHDISNALIVAATPTITFLVENPRIIRAYRQGTTTTIVDLKDDPANAVRDMAADEGTLYWTDASNRLRAVPSASVGMAPVEYAVLPSPQRLVVGDQNVYVLCSDSTGASLVAVSKTTLMKKTLATKPAGAYGAIAVDADGIYWTDLAEGDIQVIGHPAPF